MTLQKKNLEYYSTYKVINMTTGKVLVTISLKKGLNNKNTEEFQHKLKKYFQEVDYIGSSCVGFILAEQKGNLNDELFDIDSRTNPINELLNKHKNIIDDMEIHIWVDSDRPPDIKYTKKQIIKNPA